MKSRATRPELSTIKSLRTLETLKTSKVLTFENTQTSLVFYSLIRTIEASPLNYFR